jgi:very-short-patch-repair endonuclease
MPTGKQLERELLAMRTLTLDRIPGRGRDNLTCPHHGTVAWARIPYQEAHRQVTAATAARVKRRQLARAPFISKSEVWLVAGLLYYRADTFLLQHPVGPYDCDVYFPNDQVCVEVDGTLFHDPETDKLRDEHLERKGIVTRRLNTRHVTNDPLWAARQAARTIAHARRDRAS